MTDQSILFERVFVTGGSGFLGRNLLRVLSDLGIESVALARSDSAERGVRDAGCKTVIHGDLDDPTAMARGMQGCDVVFHAAALASDWGDARDFQRVNVQGTRHVLEAARAAGVSRFVHVSTEAVLLNRAPIVNADERVPRPAKPLGLYALSKGQAEDVVLAANRDGLATIIVRPRLIWGAGDTSVLPRLVEAVERGTFRWIARGDFLTSTCHVDNVVEGMLLAAERGRAGEIYFLTDGEPVRFRDFMTELLQAAGVEPGAKSVPHRVAYFLAAAVELVWRIRNRLQPPPVTRTAVKLAGQEVTVDDSKARRELGYQAKVSMDQGLAAMRASTQRTGSSRISGKDGFHGG